MTAMTRGTKLQKPFSLFCAFRFRSKSSATYKNSVPIPFKLSRFSCISYIWQRRYCWMRCVRRDFEHKMERWKFDQRRSSFSRLYANLFHFSSLDSDVKQTQITLVGNVQDESDEPCTESQSCKSFLWTHNRVASQQQQEKTHKAVDPAVVSGRWRVELPSWQAINGSRDDQQKELCFSHRMQTCSVDDTKRTGQLSISHSLSAFSRRTPAGKCETNKKQ